MQVQLPTIPADQADLPAHWRGPIGQILNPAQLGLPAAIDQAIAVQLHLTVPFRRITHREIILLHGPGGWGEFCPFPEYGPERTRFWLESALEAALGLRPEPHRHTIAVNATVPAIDALQVPDFLASIKADTIKVKVAEAGQHIDDDVARLKSVRHIMGDHAKIRVDANAAWTLDEAVKRIQRYADAARPTGADTRHPGLEYVEQPCKSVDELGRLRAKVAVPIAADESLRLSPDPYLIPGLDEACDLLVVKAAPLGGVGRALDIVAHHGKPAVVSSALESLIGMESCFALAGSLPDLGGACGLGTGRLFVRDLDPSPRVMSFGRVQTKNHSPSLPSLPVVVKLSGISRVTQQLQEALLCVSRFMGR